MNFHLFKLVGVVVLPTASPVKIAKLNPCEWQCRSLLLTQLEALFGLEYPLLGIPDQFGLLYPLLPRKELGGKINFIICFHQRMTTNLHLWLRNVFGCKEQNGFQCGFCLTVNGGIYFS